MARWGHRGAVIETDSEDAAAALERALFDHGCTVAVAAGESAAYGLKDAGMLAILVTPTAPPRGIPAILLHLEQLGVLVSRDSVSAGEGI